MKLEEIIDNIVQFLRNNIESCQTAELDANTPLIDGGLLDSFAVVSLLPDLETRFGISFPLDEIEIESFGTPRAIAEMIHKLLG